MHGLGICQFAQSFMEQSLRHDVLLTCIVIVRLLLKVTPRFCIMYRAKFAARRVIDVCCHSEVVDTDHADFVAIIAKGRTCEALVVCGVSFLVPIFLVLTTALPYAWNSSYSPFFVVALGHQ